ncbi:MAG: UvrD-helicase domain-containing protein, partial [Gemmatimonadaceae bacterium]|nr:UvrD-helicase domain-containing protein [Gemmatimonadaceae bacterium]
MTGASPMVHAFQADQAARDRAVTDLVSPLAIEAGAGSGKTSLLVSRICALLAAGVPVQHIAAITFTRKAAGELRERVMTALDRAIRGVEPPRGATWPAGDAEVTARFVAALDGLDRMYLGTIHGFCGRLLRERPVEAGLDPAFVELDEPQAMADRRAWWADFLAVRLRADDPALRALHAADVPLRRLESAFGRRVAQGDAHFPCEEWPDAVVTRELVESLVTLLDEGLALLRAAGVDPASAPPETKWDVLARVVIELAHQLAPERAAHAVGALDEPGDTALDGHAWATIVERALDADPRKSNRVAITFWSGGARTDAAKAPAKAFVAHWQAFLEGFADQFFEAHRAHLHGLVMPILNEAAA